MVAYGGESPMDFGLRFTVEAPTGTSTSAPVNAGDLFKISGTAADGSGYKAAALADNDAPDTSIIVQAIHRMTSVGPLGVLVLGRYQQVRRLPYTAGNVPTLGQSIEANGTTRTVNGKTFDGTSIVLAVDTNALLVEVLI
jgi:hypothetical protein